MAKKTGMGLNVSSESLDGPLEVPAGNPPEAAQASEKSEESRRARQDNRPICTKHGVQMVSYSSNDHFTYYRCLEPGCHETDKRVRPVGACRHLYGNGRSAKE